jgi:hypothetical protein
MQGHTVKSNCYYWLVFDTEYRNMLDLSKSTVPKAKNACPLDSLDYSIG